MNREIKYDLRAAKNYERDLLGFLGQVFQDGVEGWEARVIKFADWVTAYSKQAAERMVTGRLAENARTWRAAATEGTRGDLIARLLRAELNGPVGRRVRDLVAGNAELIKTLPKEVAATVAQRIAERQQGGSRAEVSVLGLLRHVSKVSAARIARTETAKAASALTRARSEELNLQWYVWRTSEDQRVRASHKTMDGVIVAWTDPPSPEMLTGEKSEGHYNAGEIWNCRCASLPLLRLDQVTWPHKVYYGGRVVMLTRATFKSLAGTQQPIAA